MKNRLTKSMKQLKQRRNNSQIMNINIKLNTEDQPEVDELRRQAVQQGQPVETIAKKIILEASRRLNAAARLAEKNETEAGPC